MSTPLVDFHVHYLDPRWTPTVPVATSTSGRSRINDLADVLHEIGHDKADIRVLNAPPTLVGKGPLDPGTISAVNDALATAVSAHPRELRGLATIDPWQGDTAADEVRRAIEELGLSGIVIDAAALGGDLLLDDDRVTASLTVAAELNVPVFVHPVFPRVFTDQVAPAGRAGVLLARGAVTAASLLALLQSPGYRANPNLKIVTPLITAPLLFASAFAGVELDRIWFDTMGFDAATIRYLIDAVGTEHIVVGSDSPIVADTLTRKVVDDALTRAGLSDTQIAAVSGRNALDLIDTVRTRQRISRA